MKRLIFIISILMLSACAPAQDVIQTAIAQTQAALPTIAPTNTQAPTPTSVPTKQSTNTPLPQVEKTLEAIISGLTDLVASVEGVESVTTFRRGTESLEIELKTRWASQDRQPDISFEVIKILASTFGGVDEGKAMNFVSGNPQHFSIFLTTYSTEGDYKYSSLTYYDALVKLYNRQITYDEWVKEAKAGFVK